MFSQTTRAFHKMTSQGRHIFLIWLDETLDSYQTMLSTLLVCREDHCTMQISRTTLNCKKVYFSTLAVEFLLVVSKGWLLCQTSTKGYSLLRASQLQPFVDLQRKATESQLLIYLFLHLRAAFPASFNSNMKHIKERLTKVVDIKFCRLPNSQRTVCLMLASGSADYYLRKGNLFQQTAAL